MVVPEVDKNLLEELESMGFSTARATRALHFSGTFTHTSIFLNILVWLYSLWVCILDYY